MANVTKLHQLRAAAQYAGEGVQRFCDGLAVRLYAEELADGFTFARSNAYTTTGSVIKASAGRLYGLIIEPAATAATGTGGSGFVHLYNAESLNAPWAVGSSTGGFFAGAIKFVTGFTQTILFDPATVDNSALFNSGISVAVATTHSGSTAVASLPTVTICYA